MSDGGSAFCAFLEATKALDRTYCKLFRLLLKHYGICHNAELIYSITT